MGNKKNTRTYKFLSRFTTMESKDARREVFLFLFAIMLFFFALAAETRNWGMSTLTQIFVGAAVVIGVIAIAYFIYTWRNKFGDPMDKVPEILERMDKNLTDINKKLDKLGGNNERSKRKKRKPS